MIKANKTRNHAPASRANRKAVIAGQHKKAMRRADHARIAREVYDALHD